MSSRSNHIADEKAFLEKASHTYTVDTSHQTATMRQLIVRTFRPFIKGGCGLELGCSDGFMTEMLSATLSHLDVVDGSQKFLAEARARKLSNVSFIETLFEEFESETRYDYVFASYILEHVFDPIAIMKMAKSVLKSDGLLMIVVPNARALSRQLALHMGLISDLKALTENDRNHGHRRVYDRVSLDRDIKSAGFENLCQGGIMLKILADFQMDELISMQVLQDEHIDGLYGLGLEYPDLCGSLFSVCRPKKVAIL
jgi:2-polyprenyl-3-methyl-5-hydroxy-6-metoxy-1,4-benzoquinol methylase